MPELRAPEKSRIGIEIKPKVRYPDQTQAAIVHPVYFIRARQSAQGSQFSRNSPVCCTGFCAVIETESWISGCAGRPTARDGVYRLGAGRGRPMKSDGTGVALVK